MKKTTNNKKRQIEISYNRLWKLLIDRGMKKKDLQEICGISAASVAKLGRNANVTTDLLLKICTGLNCQLNDICGTMIVEEMN